MPGLVATEGFGMNSQPHRPLLRLGVLTACCAWAMALSVETFFRQPRASIEWPDQFEHEGVIWKKKAFTNTNATTHQFSITELPPGVIQLDEAGYVNGHRNLKLVLLRSSSSGFTRTIQAPTGCRLVNPSWLSSAFRKKHHYLWLIGTVPMNTKPSICILNTPHEPNRRQS
jgi:hypothetical protein